MFEASPLTHLMGVDGIGASTFWMPCVDIAATFSRQTPVSQPANHPKDGAAQRGGGRKFGPPHSPSIPNEHVIQHAIDRQSALEGVQQFCLNKDVFVDVGRWRAGKA